MKVERFFTSWRGSFHGMSTRHRSILVSLILILLVSTTVVWRVHPWDTRPRGERLYAAYCAECHGAEGQGGLGMALDSTGHMYQHTCTQLKLHIVIGSRGSGYMPAYWGRLSEEDMTAIILSFQRWWADEQIAEFEARTTCVKSGATTSLMRDVHDR